jgi:Tfp pilus assembly protein PilF
LQQAGRSKEAAAELQLYESARNDQNQTKKLHELMERQPNNPEHLSKLGAHLLEKFDNVQGLYLLQRALAFDPNHRFAHQALARYYEKKNQPEEAAKHREFLQAPKK